MKNKESLLEILHLDKWLDRRQVLFDVSLSVSEGEVFGFLGPNGAGKTTTMKCILGLLHGEKGTITLFGKENTDIETKKNIGFMPENTYLYKYLTGREFLRFNGKFFDIPDLEDRISHLLEQVGLTFAADRYLSKYSKGMLQRVGLAQAIINNPQIVFLDEPMSGLDPIGRKMVKDIILELKNKGTTVFFNTHILSDVESLCDRFAIIHKGKIIADQTTASLKQPLEQFFIEQVEKNTTEKLEVT